MLLKLSRPQRMLCNYSFIFSPWNKRIMKQEVMHEIEWQQLSYLVFECLVHKGNCYKYHEDCDLWIVLVSKVKSQTRQMTPNIVNSRLKRCEMTMTVNFPLWTVFPSTSQFKQSTLYLRYPPRITRQKQRALSSPATPNQTPATMVRTKKHFRPPSPGDSSSSSSSNEEEDQQASTVVQRGMGKQMHFGGKQLSVVGGAFRGGGKQLRMA